MTETRFEQDDSPARPFASINRLIRAHIDALIERCRSEIVSRPQLEKIVDQLDILRSDQWLRQAIAVFLVSAESSRGPAVEWHDEVGELNFATGLSIAGASQVLGILRDAVLDLVWEAAERGDLPKGEVRDAAASVLGAYDSALAAQASAYVRESQRHLSNVNQQLELRQRTFERDLALAELVQKRFIPGSFQSENFRAEVRYEPTTGVGGDHAGLFPISPDLFYATICDVTGHGIASALVAEIVSSHVRPILRNQVGSSFQYNVAPLTVLRVLNTLFYEQFQLLGILLSSFVALIDYDAQSVTYAGGGHPPPILQCCSAHNLIELRSQNIMLGAAEDCVIGPGQDTAPIHPGDRIVFYTDGIIEANDGRGNMLGVDGLLDILRQNYETPPADLADQILSAA
ncbi:MAG: PP2C family protein-serine/threonine phosphatase, partial [bacterium]